ncbi:MAG: hypothetical protein M3R24_24255 [Chloroflexota bacterium]|nr:hypothetical protein [Chloroflexota bacterium]
MARPNPLPPEHLRQRLRALLLVGSLLGPAFCVFGLLTLLSAGWVRWLLLALWLALGVLLSLLAGRTLRTLAELQDSSTQEQAE